MNMTESKTGKLVMAGLMLAIGMLLPFVTSHAYGIKGTVLLPMHLPVLLCGFFAGPLYGSLCGLILPVLNSVCTGMPVMFPMAVIMMGELFTYGFVSGYVYEKTGRNTGLLHIYLSLIIAMVCGRVVYGTISALILAFDADVVHYSVATAVIQGIPGIVLQLAIVPSGVKLFARKIGSSDYGACKRAVNLVKSGKKTCVVVRDGKIVSASSPRGIAHLLKLRSEGVLKNSFVADSIVGKAAAMIFTEAGVKGCYGDNMSQSALEWLRQHNASARYGRLTEVIQNRRGDGMCPMEETVRDITDERDAIEALKNKVGELSSKSGDEAK